MLCFISIPIVEGDGAGSAVWPFPKPKSETRATLKLFVADRVDLPRRRL